MYKPQRSYFKLKPTSGGMFPSRNVPPLIGFWLLRVDQPVITT